MNIAYSNTTLLGLFVFILSGCAYSNNQTKQKYPTNLCNQANYGKLEIDKVSVSDSRINSYLLGCSVRVVISEVSFTSGAHKGDTTVKANKQAIADYLLSQKLDVTYTNEDGDYILMLVVMSFL